MVPIFLSYSRQDSTSVDQLISKLEGRGCSVWIDRTGIHGGELWRKRVVNAIIDSGLFVILLSPNSVQSENVRKELDLAEEEQKHIIPVRLQPVKILPEMKYQLAGLQMIDLSITECNN